MTNFNNYVKIKIWTKKYYYLINNLVKRKFECEKVYNLINLIVKRNSYMTYMTNMTIIFYINKGLYG